MSGFPKVTVEEFWMLGEEVRAELIDGLVLPKAQAAPQHGLPQGNLIAWLIRRYARPPGGRWPGGWWIAPEMHVVYGTHDVYCHDLAGWKRERFPEFQRTKGWVHVMPDWVCEVLSLGHERRDRVEKMRTMHGAGVPHYWIIDSERQLVHAYRNEPGGFALELTASNGEVIRAQPFEHVDLRLPMLFGDEGDED